MLFERDDWQGRLGNERPGLANALFSAFERAERDARNTYAAGCINIALVGDSITYFQSQTGYRHSLEQTTGANIGSMLVYRRGQQDIPAAGGTGTMQFYYHAQRPYLTWQAPSDTEGPAIYLTTSGVFMIPSGSANKGMEVALQLENDVGTSLIPTSDKTDTTTITANSWTNLQTAQGPTMWANALLGRPLRIVGNFSGAGLLTSFAIGAVDQAITALGSTPGIVQICIGTNDLGNAVAPATITALFDEIVEAVLSAGHYLLIVNISPRSETGWQTTAFGITWAQKVLRMKQVNEYFATLAKNNSRIGLVDAFSAFVDLTSTTDSETSGYLIDHLHYATSGAYRVGKLLATFYSELLPQHRRRFTTSFADVYDATYNLTGNLINTAGMGVMAGTTGTKGTGVSGNVSTGWRVQRASFPTSTDIVAVCSKVSATFNGVTNPDALKVAIDNAAGATVQEMVIDIAAGALPSFGTNYSAGDAITGWAVVNIDTNVGLEGVEFAIIPGGVSNNFQVYDLFYFSTTYLPLPDGITETLTFEVPDDSADSPGFTIPTGKGVTSVNIRIQVAIAAGGSANITVGFCKVWKIA